MGYPSDYKSPEEIFNEIRTVTPSYAGITYGRIENEVISFVAYHYDQDTINFILNNVSDFELTLCINKITGYYYFEGVTLDSGFETENGLISNLNFYSSKIPANPNTVKLIRTFKTSELKVMIALKPNLSIKDLLNYEKDKLSINP